MKPHPTLIRAIALAATRGSKAHTPKGVLQTLQKFSLHFGPTLKPLTAELHQVHTALDHAPIGSKVRMPGAKIPGFRRFKFEDSGMATQARQEVERDNPRKRNLFSGNAVTTGNPVQEREETIYYKGKHKGRTGSNLFADYQGCIALSASGRTAVLVIGCVIFRRLRAPKGMVFDKDASGVLLRRKSDGMDYHPTPTDWRSRSFATTIRKAMAANYGARLATDRLAREQARSQKLFERDLGNTFVTLADSRRAGNCIEGSLNFAEKKLGIPREEVLAAGHLFKQPATRLLRVANGLTDRVMAAIQVAWQRETMVSI